MSMQGWQALHSLSRDSSVKERRLAPGTTRRVMGYARPYKVQIAWFLGIVVIESVLVVASPLLLKSLVDDGIYPKDSAVVVRLSLLVALIAIVGAGLTLVERWFSARIGEGLIYDLRTQVFSHVLRQPVAFFTRAQTGALVTRLGNDVIGAQQAFTSVLSSVVSNAITLVLIVVAMALLSWPLTLGALALVPFFLVPARLMGRRLAGLAHEQMVQNAEVGTRMTERFNVAGALLVKLFGRPAVEDEEYAVRAAKVRDIGVRIAVNRSVFFVALTLVASLATAMVYGVGGLMAVNGTLTVGTLLALTALLAPALRPAHRHLQRAGRHPHRAGLVRAGLRGARPRAARRRGARRPAGARRARCASRSTDVSFSYPSADEVSLASLETTATGDRGAAARCCTTCRSPSSPAPSSPWSARAAPARPPSPRWWPASTTPRPAPSASTGSTCATRRPSRCTTPSAWSPRTPTSSTTRSAPTSPTPRPTATEDDMVAALRAAQVWSLVDSLPSGLDTVVGDRGHRLSGGEKQRLAIARLLLKGPGLIVLDEATAHLDSESEQALQRALDHALRDRSALVIAHRLSTVRHADLILVVDDGTVVERGTHHELVAAGGLYSELYRTQFTTSSARCSTPAPDRCR